VLDPALANGIEDEPVLVAQDLFFLLIGEIAFGDLLGVGSRSFADTTAAHEDLGLQNQLIFPSLALHVVDRVALFYICVKAENHAVSIPLEKRSCLAHRTRQRHVSVA